LTLDFMRKRICFVTASPLTLRAFMRNHMLRLADTYDVSAVSSFSTEDLVGDWAPGVRLVRVPIAREIKPFVDVRAIWALLQFFRSERFDIVHSVTPKAGLLAMFAAWLAGVPVRIHCFTGQVWATKKGIFKAILKMSDRFIALTASHILTDSQSQRGYIEEEGVVSRGRAIVLGAGSISGVDLERFHPDKSMRARIRYELAIPTDAFLVLFVGRLNRDKGVLDLACAFAEVALAHKDIWLVVVGPDEECIADEFAKLCGAAISHVVSVGFTTTPEHYMTAADVFALPSYREGFGTVVIEAAACGLPTVASNIYGLCDAVEENVTGLLHPPGDVAALKNRLLTLYADSDLRLMMANNARVRAQDIFSMNALTVELVKFYNTLLHVEPT
jgi:glycosyltransferase involved in cell wall biosynthesis